jgi:hypothetical protein
MNKPTKNTKEMEVNQRLQAKYQGLKDWQILQKTFQALK